MYIDVHTYIKAGFDSRMFVFPITVRGKPVPLDWRMFVLRITVRHCSMKACHTRIDRMFACSWSLSDYSTLLCLNPINPNICSHSLIQFECLFDSIRSRTRIEGNEYSTMSRKTFGILPTLHLRPFL